MKIDLADFSKKIAKGIKPYSDLPITGMTNDEKWAPENFEILGLMFELPYSRTYKIVHKDTEEYAFLKKSRNFSQYKTKFFSEERIWKKASPHPYIAELYSVYPVEDSKYYIFEFLSHGSLRNIIKVHKVLQTNVAVFLTAQIASAVEFLHKKDIFHREVSNRHILLSADGQAKLTSFRHALMNKTARGVHCNLYYQAPEVFSGQIYDQTADWYSLGVCLYEMVMGMTPLEYHCMRNSIAFKELDNTGKIVVILSSTVYIPDIFPKPLKSMLNGLLQKNQEDRYGYTSTSFLKNHLFFSDVDWEQVESGLLKVDLP